MYLELHSKRLVLEPLVASHAQTLYTSLLDDRLYRYIPLDPPASEQTLRERYHRLEAGQSPDGSEIWLNWAMRPSATREYAGTLQATVHPNQTAYVAYIVFPPYQGRGYATEGLRRVMDFLLQEHETRTLIAEIDTRNTASIAVVERLGFRRVKTVKDAAYFKGSASDEYRCEFVV